MSAEPASIDLDNPAPPPEASKQEAQHPTPPPSAVLAPAPPSPPSVPTGFPWPNNHAGLVCIIDPSSTDARQTLEILQSHTNNALNTTPWLFEATHVVLDDSKPISLGWYQGGGRELVNVDWVRDSFFAGESLDVKDKKYEIAREEHKQDEHRLTRARSDGSRGGGTKRKGGREEERPPRKKPSWSYEQISPPNLSNPPSRQRGKAWTESEDEDYARYIASKPRPNINGSIWPAYQRSHPHRTLDAYTSRYRHNKEYVDKVIRRIKRRAKGQPIVYHHPSPSRPSSSSRRNLEPSSSGFFSSGDDDDLDSGAEEQNQDDEDFDPSARPSNREQATMNRLRRSATGDPCVNCNLEEDLRWYKLRDVDGGAGQYCEGCRSAFSAKTSINEGKAALARRRNRLVVPSRRSKSDASTESNNVASPPPPPSQPRRFQRQSSPFSHPAPQPPFPSSFQSPYHAPESFAFSFMGRPPAPPPSLSSGSERRNLPPSPKGSHQQMERMVQPMMMPPMRQNDDESRRGSPPASNDAPRPVSPPFPSTSWPIGPSSFGPQPGMDLHLRHPFPPPSPPTPSGQPVPPMPSPSPVASTSTPVGGISLVTESSTVTEKQSVDRDSGDGADVAEGSGSGRLE